MKTWVGLVALVAVGLLPRLGAAQAIDNIGNAGQIVVGAERLMGLGYSTNRTVQRSGDVEVEMESSQVTLGLGGWDAPTPFQVPRFGIDYFVTNGLSVGAALVYFRLSGESKIELTQGGQTQGDSSENGPAHHLLLHPRVGYSFIIDETFAIWPRAGITWVREWSSQEIEALGPSGNPVTHEIRRTETLLALSADANLVISPMQHFAFLIGPFMDLTVSSSVEVESDMPGSASDETDREVAVYGLHAGIAGYF